MEYKVSEIRELSIEGLISTLCYNMFDDRKVGRRTQKRICDELERRGIIEDANELDELLSK